MRPFVVQHCSLAELRCDVHPVEQEIDLLFRTAEFPPESLFRFVEYGLEDIQDGVLVDDRAFDNGVFAWKRGKGKHLDVPVLVRHAVNDADLVRAEFDAGYDGLS